MAVLRDHPRRHRSIRAGATASTVIPTVASRSETGTVMVPRLGRSVTRDRAPGPPTVRPSVTGQGARSARPPARQAHGPDGHPREAAQAGPLARPTATAPRFRSRVVDRSQDLPLERRGWIHRGGRAERRQRLPDPTHDGRERRSGPGIGCIEPVFDAPALDLGHRVHRVRVRQIDQIRAARLRAGHNRPPAPTGRPGCGRAATPVRARTGDSAGIRPCVDRPAWRSRRTCSVPTRMP